ncbi:MAG: ABC transporter permease [Verrucomicrobia bacterium]|nr:ABC transporter permease [Verrucomicrobiota bacterium]
MTAYIIRRLFSVIPITMGVLLLVFVIYRVIGGDPAVRLAGKNATPQKIEQIRKTFGYDKPKFFNWQEAWQNTKPAFAQFRMEFARYRSKEVGVGTVFQAGFRLLRAPMAVFDSQFWQIVRQFAQLDFGKSLQSNQRISRMMADGVVPSLCITTPIFVIELFVAIALALLCAFYRNTWLDRTFVVISIVGMSISGLVYIMLGQYFFSFELGWFPVWGFEGVNYVLLPVAIGVIAGIGGSLRFYRTIMLDEMYQDYVRTAFAKGASHKQVLFKHVLKNAAIPILTNVVVAIPFLYTGSLMLESFFGIPGLGRMTVDAIYTGDEPVLFAMVFIGSVIFVIANLITDLCYTWADPRIRLQ